MYLLPCIKATKILIHCLAHTERAVSVPEGLDPSYITRLHHGSSSSALAAWHMVYKRASGDMALIFVTTDISKAQVLGTFQALRSLFNR